MSSINDYLGGFLFLIIGIITSVIFTFIVGTTIDGTIHVLEGIPLLSQVPEIWATAAHTDIYFWRNLAYMFAISPAILGVIAVFMSAVKRQRAERVQEEMLFDERQVMESEV